MPLLSVSHLLFLLAFVPVFLKIVMSLMAFGLTRCALPPHDTRSDFLAEVCVVSICANELEGGFHCERCLQSFHQKSRDLMRH